MLSTEIAVLLVADAHADQWLQLIRQADASVHIECVPSIRDVPERIASASFGVLCLDGVLTTQNSLPFVEELIANANLPSHAPIILLTSDAEIAARYKSQSCVTQVLLCRSPAEHAVCVAEFRSLLAQSRLQSQLQLFAAALAGTSNGLMVHSLSKGLHS